jgi:hypothetical protein
VLVLQDGTIVHAWPFSTVAAAGIGMCEFKPGSSVCA